jgi:hypothetical protein
VEDLSSFVGSGCGLILSARNIYSANRQAGDTEGEFNDFGNFLHGRKRVRIAFSDLEFEFNCNHKRQNIYFLAANRAHSRTLAKKRTGRSEF